MSVTIRDVNTNEEIIIPPEGLIFGRTGGDADIQLDDNTISRRQARVSLKNGNWLVETIAVAAGQRPPRPVTLVEGQTFIVGQNEFEVVAMGDADEGGSEEEPAPSPPPARAPARATAAKPVSRSPTMKTTPAQAAAPRKASAPAAAAKKPARVADPDDAAGNEGGGDAEAEEKGIASMFVAVPKGIAYYLVNVPKMLFNPLGTVRSAIEELPAEPMGRTELIGYALPALLATGMLGAISTGLALLIGPGHIFSVMSFIPIVPIIAAFIGAIITGFIFHPVLEWVIRKLKGESDARSRTNYFLQSMTVAVVLAVPSAIGTILGALPIPFINLLGPLLVTVASLVSIYVMYQWFVFFGVVKWFQTVILVIGALSVLFAAFGLVVGVVNTIRGFGSSHPTAVVETGSAGDGEADDEARKAMNEGAAVAAADAPSADPEPAEKPVAKTVTAKTVKQPEPDPEPVVTEDAPPAAKPVVAEPVAKPAAKSGSYAEFARKREAVERTLENDPTVLASNGDLADAYGEYLKAANEVEKNHAKDISKNSDKRRLYERLRDADLFKTTGKQIDSLYAKLKIR